MSEETAEATSGTEQAAQKAGDLWAELAPVASFIIVYNILRRTPPMFDGRITPDSAVFWATGALMVVVAIVIAIKLYRKQKITPLLIISSTLVGVFGVIGIVFQDKTFLYIKPTVINLAYSIVILGGLAFDKNVWQLILKDGFKLPDFVWDMLAIRWALFFIGLAILNEYLWRNFSEDFWSNMKIANIPITMAFFFVNAPLTLKYLDKTDEEAAAIRAGKAPPA